MIAFEIRTQDAPSERSYAPLTAAAAASALDVTARRTAPADGTAGVGTAETGAVSPGGVGPAGDPGVDDLVTSAPLTGTVARFYTFAELS